MARAAQPQEDKQESPVRETVRLAKEDAKQADLSPHEARSPAPRPIFSDWAAF